LTSILCLALVTIGVSVLAAARSPDRAAQITTPTQQSTLPTRTATPAPGNDWTQYRYDLLGTGTNPEQLIDATNVSQLKSHWTYDNKSVPYMSTPAIVAGVIYITSGNVLSAYNLDTGAKLWTFTAIKPAPGAINSSVAVDTSRHLAYFGAPNDYFYAIDTRTGRDIWEVKLGEPDDGAWIWSSPLLVHDNVYIGLASRGDHPCVRGQVFALDAGNGITRWTHYFAPEGELGGAVWSSVTADVDEHAILATTGNPCISQISDLEQDSIVAMDWDTGKTIWSYTALQVDDCDCDFGQGPVTYTVDGQKYIVAGNKFGTLYGLARTANGVRLAWSRRIAQSDGTFTGGIFQPPSYKDGMIYVGSGTLLDGSCAGGVWALHGDTGEVAWARCTPQSIVSPTAITGNVLFAANDGGVLNAYDIKTGAVLWHTAIPGNLWGGVAIAQGHVVIGSVKGKLYCFTLGGA
jgi:outer membrane protein assembly factor BamB